MAKNPTKIDARINDTTFVPMTPATSANQTDGSQKTKIVDGSGNVIGATSNALDVNIKSGSTITIDSEFPAAAAITDNFANPTTTNVMSMEMVYDGSTWDRMLGDSTNGVLVNLGTNNDVTITSGTIIPPPRA